MDDARPHDDRARRARWLPVAGVASLVTGAIAGVAPAVQAAPAAPTGPDDDGSLRQLDPDGDGTYESCEAYFGFGKQAGAIDVVAFDVADEGAASGHAHAVPTDTGVVLRITGTDGTIECRPQEVTEAAWDQAMDDAVITWTAGQPAPAWPGPGHYAYPSLAYEPLVDEVGAVVEVAYRVTSIPSGHELVSPGGPHVLDQHHRIGWESSSTVSDPRVLALLEDTGTDVADQRLSSAFAAALAACADDDQTPISGDAVEAFHALLQFRGLQDGYDPECWDLGNLNSEVSFVLAVQDAAGYTEAIRLAVPDQATTSTTSGAVAGGPGSPTSTTPAPAATPVTATPRLTG